MKAKQALELIAESEYLIKSPNPDVRLYYYVWLTFVRNYKRADFSKTKARLADIVEMDNALG